MLYVINISVKLGGESVYAGYLARPIKSKLIDMGGLTSSDVGSDAG